MLESYDRPLTAGEVRDILHGIVGESQWTSWWSAARKHQQVVASGGGRQTYRWAETSGDALDSVWKSFAAARHHLAAPRPAGQALVDAVVAVVLDDENAGLGAGRDGPETGKGRSGEEDAH